MTYDCYFCDREFNSWNALRQHKDTLEHWECETCDQIFGSQYTANAHMTSLYHWGTAVECDKCDRTFKTWKACKRHMTRFGHWFTDVCDTCDRRFVDRIAVEQHMLAVGHKAQHRCTKCDCSFQTENDWFKHMTSPIHTRAEPIQAAPAPPVRPTPAPQSASTAAEFKLSACCQSDPDSVLSQAVAAALAVVSAQSTSSLSSGIHPTNTGTFFAPFNVFVEHDNASSITSRYQSITFMQHYQTFSFEELRLADYMAGRRPVYLRQQSEAFAQHTDSRNTLSPNADTFQPVCSVNPAPTLSAVRPAEATQTDSSFPESLIYLEGTASRTTPSITNHRNAESHTARSSATTVEHTQESSTALTDEDNAKFKFVHEAHARVTKLVRNNENEGGWISQGVGPVRILVSKDTFAPRVLMRAEPSGKVGLDLDVMLGSTFHDLKAPKMLHMNALSQDKKKIETSMCVFKDEFEAREFLDKLHKVIAKAQDAFAEHPLFSLSEITAQQTEPVEKPEGVNSPFCQERHADPVAGSQITNCPFCRLGFYAVFKVLQHLEATSCRARPDLNRGNIYHHIHEYDTGAYITESFSDSNLSVPENEESLYHCPSMTGKCQGKRLHSFAALYAHLESDDCDLDGRSDLLQDFSNIENWVPAFGSC